MCKQRLTDWLRDYRTRTRVHVTEAVARCSGDFCDLDVSGAEAFVLAQTANTEAMIDALVEYSLVPPDTRQDYMVVAAPTIHERAAEARAKILAECCALRQTVNAFQYTRP